MSFVSTFVSYLKRRPAGFSIALAVLLVVIIGVVDYVTTDISLLVFYLIPISLTVWTAGLQAGIFISLLSALSLLINDIIETPVHIYWFHHHWELLANLGFLMSYTYLLSALKRALEKERQLARTDDLTGALNGRAFLEQANQELERAHRYQRRFSLAYLDLDNFKPVNDRLGHSTGDRLLQEVVKTIKQQSRITDFTARLGGDEFAVFLPETDADAARTHFNRLQKSLQETMGKNNWPVTFSIGAVTYRQPPDSVDEMLRKADRLMYDVKNNQKNMLKHEVVEKLLLASPPAPGPAGKEGNQPEER